MSSGYSHFPRLLTSVLSICLLLPGCSDSPKPPPALSALDLIVRSSSLTLRCQTSAGARLALRVKGQPESSETTASTAHRLHVDHLSRSTQYTYDVVSVASPESPPLASGELTTLSESAYWEADRDRPAPSALTPLGKNREGFQEFRNEIDGTVMILVPGAEYAMGDPRPDGRRDARPVHKVRVDTFLLDKLPITRKAYRDFVILSGYAKLLMEPKSYPSYDDRPMGRLSWDNATDYCRWAGKRLPTTAEWELAATGGTGRRHPWGDEPPRPGVNVDSRYPDTRPPLPVGSLQAGAGPYGHLDLQGGVRNWCSDWYDPGYYAVSPYRNPLGPSASPTAEKSERGVAVDVDLPFFPDVWHIWSHSGFAERPESSGFRGARDP